MKATERARRIDFAAVADRADLRALIVADLGEPDRSKKWCCPFHDDRHPSLGLTNGGKTFRCWSCGAKGDPLKWLTMRGHASNVVEAAKMLDPALGPFRPSGSPPGGRSAQGSTHSTSAKNDRPKRPVDAPGVWADIEWQDVLNRAIIRAEANLWTDVGATALEWLKGRGLMEWTIRKFRLGFIPTDWRSDPLAAIRDKEGKPASLWLPRGILIPWLAPGAWYGDLHGDVHPMTRWVGANVRRLRPDPFEPWQGGAKCLAASGSVRGYGYPFPDELTVVNHCGNPPVLVCEGEIDALLAHQIVGDMVTVVTVGSANQDPAPETMAALEEIRSPWLLAHDADKAGEAGARRWRAFGSVECRRILYPPEGSDIGELVQAGVDLRSWIKAECARLEVTL